MTVNAAKPSASAGPKGRSWGAERRLQFIDFRLRWEGRINRADLTEYFGVSVPQASLDLSKYIELAPSNLEYDRSSKAYLASSSFHSVFPQTSAQHYLAELLATNSGLIDSASSFIGSMPKIEMVPMPNRSLNDATVSAVVMAIREKYSIRVNYQSMSSLDETARLISPHALGFDGFRWHVRAFCHSRLRFSDFVLARILRIEGVESNYIDSASDSQWHNVVTLHLAANERLEPARKRVIELDYGMQNGEVELPCRQAFLLYTLKRLGLLTDSNADPRTQHIYLKNRNEIQPYINGLIG